MPIAILIGLGAGLASAVLFASASTGTALGLFVLFLLSPMPLLIAGLGWGWGSALVAAFSAAAAIVLVGNGRAMMFHMLAIGVPAVVAAWLALLSRPAAAASGLAPERPDQVLEWYPLERIVGWAVVWASALTGLALLAIGPDVETLRVALTDAFEKMLVVQGAGGGAGGSSAAGRLTDADKKAFVEIMVISLPWAIATCWMAIAMLNVWGAAHVVRLSGRLGRPWPDLSMLVLPRLMPVAFAAAVALTFLPGMAGLIASGSASAILFAYLLVGLAILHAVTRGLAARPMMLTLIYGALLMLSPFSSLAVAMIGLAEPVSPLRRRPPSAPPSKGPPSNGPVAPRR